MRRMFFLSVCALLFSCGDNSPFDEDYWDNNDGAQREDLPSEEKFEASLRPLSSLVFVSGTAFLEFDGDTASLDVRMTQVPHNIIQGQISVTSSRCEDITSNPPSVSPEIKDFRYIENGSRAVILRDITDPTRVEGLSILVTAFTTASDTSPSSGLFPLACGTLVVDSRDPPPDPVPTTVGGVAGGTTGGAAGTIGTVAGGVVGSTTGTGTTLGGAGGTAAGTGPIGGATGGTVVGTVGGATVVGTVGGATVVGTVGGGTGTTAAGTVGGTTGF